MFLLVPREDYGSFHPRVPRIPQVNIRIDERGKDGVLWENGGTKCERSAKRSSKTSNHLLSRERSASDEISTHVPISRLVMKVPAPFRYTSDKAVP